MFTVPYTRKEVKEQVWSVLLMLNPSQASIFVGKKKIGEYLTAIDTTVDLFVVLSYEVWCTQLE